jgi:hypothetical protein
MVPLVWGGGGGGKGRGREGPPHIHIIRSLVLYFAGYQWTFILITTQKQQGVCCCYTVTFPFTFKSYLRQKKNCGNLNIS